MTRSSAARNLVLCSDGTGQRGGKTRTNVWRIYQAIDRTSTNPEQLAFYEDGVGSEDFKLIKLIGKITGMGLSANIRGLYRWLMLNYREGDRIFLFGFSRGAYTVRSFAGMLKHCGLALGEGLDASQAEVVVKEIYSRYYRGRLWRRLLSWIPGAHASRRPVPDRFLPKTVELDDPLRVAHPEIWFLGVWDTVGAVGLPAWLRAGRWSPMSLTSKFHDINAGNWWNAFHAVAVDDERKSFWPEPLPQPGDTAGFTVENGQASVQPKPPANGSESSSAAGPVVDVDQVLFAGAHTNVGGGYPKDGLAFNALDWIATKARHRGLQLSNEARAQIRHRKNAHDRIYDPRSGLASYYRYSPRDFEEIKKVYRKRYRADGHMPLGLNRVHESVFDRIERATAGYAPANLPANAKVTATGKGNGGQLRQREKNRMAEYQRRLGFVRQAGISSGVKWPVRWRKTLYWGLIGFTLAAVCYVVWLLEHPGDEKRAQDQVAQIQLYALPQTAQPRSDVADKPGSVLKTAQWLVGKAGALLLPKAAEQVGQQILEQAWTYPEAAVPLALAFGGALIWRQKLKKKTGEIGQQGWQPFRRPPSGGGAKPLTQAAHSTGSGKG